jgi:predicted DCC family thiol-disulfide oxidoreductase YuxK
MAATFPHATPALSPSAQDQLSIPILIFDGDCGFCTMSVNFMRRWIRPRAQILAWQFADLDALGLTEAECTEAVQWVPTSGDNTSGAAAVANVLRASPVPWPVAGMIMAAPLVRVVADRVYKLIAKNRFRLPGSTPACKVAAQSAAA